MKTQKITLLIVFIVLMVLPSGLFINYVKADPAPVFTENFDSADSVSANWSPYGSAFSVSDGIGTLLPDGSIVPVFFNHKATIHDKGSAPIFFQDLVYTVDVKLTSAKRTMLCFGLDSADRRMWVGYDVGSVGYGWSNDREDSSRIGGAISVLEDYRPYDGQWHRWRIEVVGSQFDFWIDDHHILTGQLDGYLPGPIGMRAWDSGRTQFDNLTAVSNSGIIATPRPSPTQVPTPSSSPIPTPSPIQITPSPSPMATQAPGLLSTERYYNNEYDFSIIPPNGWSTNEEIGSTSSGTKIPVLFSSPPSIQCSIGISVTNYAGTTLSEVVDSIKNEAVPYSNYQRLSETYRAVAGINCWETIETYTSSAGLDVKTKSLVLVENDKIFLIIFMVDLINYDNYLATFENSIQTLEIYVPASQSNNDFMIYVWGFVGAVVIVVACSVFFKFIEGIGKKKSLTGT